MRRVRERLDDSPQEGFVEACFHLAQYRKERRKTHEEGDRSIIAMAMTKKHKL